MTRQSKFIPSSLVDMVSSVLTDKILEGNFNSGDRLSEMELKQQFGTSGTPIREAFRVLEKKGLVEIIPRKGTFVRSISHKDIEENYPVRAVIEGLAAGEASKKMTEQELHAMELAFENMRTSAESRRIKDFWKHHLSFHEIFINASANIILIEIASTLRMHHMWYRFCYKYYEDLNKEDLKKSLSVHNEILRLFKCRKPDSKKIEQVVRDHIEVNAEKFSIYMKNELSKRN